MKGVTVTKAGGPFEVTDGIDKPKPGKKDILVKSLVTGINPMQVDPILYIYIYIAAR